MFAKNCTPVTVPGLVSAAVALTVTAVPAVEVDPAAGADSATVGGGFVVDATVTLRAAEVVVAPPLSVATAINEYDPAVGVHDTL